METPSRYPSLHNLGNEYESVHSNRTFHCIAPEVAFDNNAFPPVSNFVPVTDPLPHTHHYRLTQPDDDLRSLKRNVRYVCWVLMVMCLLLVAIFIYEFYGIKDKFSDKSESSTHPYCFVREDIDSFDKSWRSHDRRQRDNGNICFEKINWMFDVITQVKKNVTEKIDNYKSELIHNLTSSSANNGNLSATCHSMKLPVYPRPFAHLFFDARAKYEIGEKEDQCTLVKFTKSGIDDSNMRMMRPNGNSEVEVVQPGYYFIYSHARFKQSGDLQHVVYKNWRDHSSDGRMKLLENDWLRSQSLTSFVQGTFELKAGDKISMCASVSQLYNDTGKHIFLGTYLISG